MRRVWLCGACVLLFVVFLYWPVLDFAYVWDDVALFLDSAALRGALGWWEAITQPILPGTTYFRPLVLSTIYVEFQVGEPSPTLSHAINLVVFLINCMLVGRLAYVLTHDQSMRSRHVVSFVAMLFYGVHPAQIESVAWVAGRFDLMVTMFTLMALLLAVRASRVSLFLMAICFFAAALSKEMAATLPLLLVLLHLSHSSYEGVERLFKTVMVLRRHLFVLMVAGLLYLAIRSHVMSSLYHQDQSVSSSLSPLTHLALIGSTIFYYFKTIFLPFSDIGPLHPVDASRFDGFEIMGGLFSVLVCVGYCFWAALRGGGKSILILVAIVALLPVLNIIPLTIGGNVGHERFLSLPLAFIAVFIGVLLVQLPRFSISSGFRRVAFGLMIVWLVVASYVVSAQLPFWRSGQALWSWAYAKNPNSEYAQFSLVADLIRQGDLESAGALLKEIESRSGETSLRLHILKASHLQRTGQYDEALVLMDSVLKEVTVPHAAILDAGIKLEDAHISRETFSEGWTFRFIYGVRAEAYIGLRRFKEALEAARIGQFYQEDYPPLHFLEAVALYGLDSVSEGDEAWGEALALYVGPGQDDAKLLMKSFKKQICVYEDKPQRYCSRKD